VTTETIHIYHTNDIHSHFEYWPNIAAFIKKQRKINQAHNEPHLCFDIGDHADLFHPLTEGTNGKGNIALMNQIGYDNATIGNNEGITFSKEALDNLYSNAKFQVVLSNLKNPDGSQPHWAKPYDLHVLKNGIKVGVLGVTAPFSLYFEMLGWTVQQPMESLSTLVKELRDQVDILILLSHLGFENDCRIAEEMNGIDLILGAHTHHLLKEGSIVNNTFIGQAGRFGQFVGHIKLTYDTKNNALINTAVECVDVAYLDSDEETLRNLQSLTDKAEQKLSESVAAITADLPVSWYKPSPLTKLLAEALREWTEAEIGMVNAGTLLEGLKKGEITRKDLHEICPHPINPCKVQLEGGLLKEIILHSLTEEMINLKVKGLGFRGKVMGIMVYDGVEIEGKVLEDGQFHVRELVVNGRQLEPERTYTIGTIDMFTFGRLYPAIVHAKNKHYFLPEMLRDLLAWKLKRIN
jgi:5'-nucleotidase